MEVSFYLPLPPGWIVGAFAWWWMFGLFVYMYKGVCNLSRNKWFMDGYHPIYDAWIPVLVSICWPYVLYRHLSK
ncbi:TMhelix containing protein [Vibrio phage 1.123.O._10N.286.48.F3]|nr:TMhelix containing protein [Vibrio phage 1.123.O._10N.286.48.F3]